MSGSPAEVVEPFCREYGLGSFLCTEMGTKNGSFDGNVTRNMIISENKERMFEELVSSRGIRLEKAFGFGDTKQDMPFLSRVGYPVPLNPDDELKEEAVKRGWPFFDYSRTGIFIEKGHELEGRSVGGKVLVFPNGKGSTVGSYVIYGLKKNGVAPKAIINKETETIVATGVILAGIPCIDGIDITAIKTGQTVTVNADRNEVTVND
jgi:predicted aconitase with swiveling domain